METSPPADAFTITTEDVPATHTVIEVTEDGTVAGRSEVIRHGDGKHLVLGRTEWIRPDGLDTDASAEHFHAVEARLVGEAVAIAERERTTLAVLTPGALGSARAKLLGRHGFQQLGQLWWRSQQ